MVGALVYIRRRKGLRTWESSGDRHDWRPLGGAETVADAMEAARMLTGVRMVAVTDHEDDPNETIRESRPGDIQVGAD